jgi:hypothetical protein
MAGSTQGDPHAIQITGPVRAVLRLIARGKPPLMDCQLGYALARTAPQMLDLGRDGLSFSGTYSTERGRHPATVGPRPRAGRSTVHAWRPAGLCDVQRDYPKEPAAGTPPPVTPTTSADCVVGEPARPGPSLRAHAGLPAAHDPCRLVMGPDDNYDHRNHLHLEAHIDGPPTAQRDTARATTRDSVPAASAVDGSLPVSVQGSAAELQLQPVLESSGRPTIHRVTGRPEHHR